MHRESDKLRVYVDGGFNKGQTHTRNKLSLHKPDLYFAFEPDPRHAEEIQDKVSRGEIIFFSMALWDLDSFMIFHQCNREDEQAGSLNRNKWSEEAITVPCIDIERFTRSYLDPANENVLKLDVESAEYRILPHLIRTNTLKEYYSELEVEWHRASHFPLDNIASLTTQKRMWDNIREQTEQYCKIWNIKYTVLR